MPRPSAEEQCVQLDVCLQVYTAVAAQAHEAAVRRYIHSASIGQQELLREKGMRDHFL